MGLAAAELALAGPRNGASPGRRREPGPALASRPRWLTLAGPYAIPGTSGIMHPNTVPDVVFHTRVRNEALAVSNPYEWRELTSADVFGGRNIVLFALPGAFTPACSDEHLPSYENTADEFKILGIDQVICLAVNDAFVLFQWAKINNITKVFMLPDGNGDFTRQMGMLVQRTKQGMGMRSWRYSMHVQDGVIRKLFAEPGYGDNPPGVPLKISGAQTMLEYLRGIQA